MSKKFRVEIRSSHSVFSIDVTAPNTDIALTMAISMAKTRNVSLPSNPKAWSRITDITLVGKV